MLYKHKQALLSFDVHIYIYMNTAFFYFVTASCCLLMWLLWHFMSMKSANIVSIFFLVFGICYLLFVIKFCFDIIQLVLWLWNNHTIWENIMFLFTLQNLDVNSLANIQYMILYSWQYLKLFELGYWSCNSASGYFQYDTLNSIELRFHGL